MHAWTDSLSFGRGRSGYEINTNHNIFLRDFCSIYASVASFAIYVNNLPSWRNAVESWIA